MSKSQYENKTKFNNWLDASLLQKIRILGIKTGKPYTKFIEEGMALIVEMYGDVLKGE